MGKTVFSRTVQAIGTVINADDVTRRGNAFNHAESLPVHLRPRTNLGPTFNDLSGTPCGLAVAVDCCAFQVYGNSPNVFEPPLMREVFLMLPATV